VRAAEFAEPADRVASLNRPRQAYQLSEIVKRFGGELLGDGDVRIIQVATLETAGPGQISFFANSRYRKQLEQTRADAVILTSEASDSTQRPRIVCKDPYAYFARLSALLNPPAAVVPGIHPLAAIHPAAVVAASASIGPFTSIGPGAEVGERSLIEAGCALGENVRIGQDCRLYSGVSVYHDCTVGDRVILHSGVIIGADGFGIAWEGGRWHKIPQIGRVLLGDDVEVGANTTIDRGALDDTVIEEGVKLDNQIQIGHNCRIGAHTAIAGCVGVAGSTRIGRYCRIGGSAMIGGHLEIADHVEISGATGVSKSIPKAGTYTSLFPMSLHRDWLRNASHIRHLDSLAGRLRELEARLAELEGKKNE
jgi:UDP-3-O-[3-hydroxymyristoyl] glucosamine N-acyltransferase